MDSIRARKKDLKKTKPNKKSLGKIKRVKIKNIIIFGLALGVFSLGAVILWAATLPIPTLETFEQRKVVQSTKIYDQTGEELLFDVFENIKRTVVPFEEISPHIKSAALAIEDVKFYEHSGVRPMAFLRALFVNIGSLSLQQGGSTITQQVIKNSVLTPEKTFARKIKEWVLAVRLEKVTSKEEIFSIYLNEIPFGGSIYGVQEASQTFFGKDASDVTVAQAAYLAALPQAPTRLSPYGQNREFLDSRKNTVLGEMLRYRFISEEEYQEALEEEVEFRPRGDQNIKAPHFVMFVKEELTDIFGEKILEEAGLRVTTTLNWELQEKAEEMALRYALENKTNFNAENISLVATDPKSGDILVMVGSRDYFDEEIDGNFNVAATHNRQPGSSFKPFVYAEAFNKGYTPETIIFDLQTQFSTTCPSSNFTSIGTCYSPVNYDNTFRGPVTMRNALAQSINVPAVKTSYLAGMNDVLTLSREMGVSGLTGNYGLTLALGGGEVSLLDMTSAYGVFANGGVKSPYRAIKKVEDREGNVLFEAENTATRVLAEDVALSITDILSDNSARAPAFGENSLLRIPGREVAVKTGTTNDYVDAWIIGYTPSIAVGAWAGNNDSRSMERRVAGFIIAPFWNEFMREVLNEFPEESFKRPPQKENFNDLKPVLRGKWQGGIPVYLEKNTGKLATEFTPEGLREEVLVGGVHSILHWVDKRNPRGPIPSNPESDPQYNHWQYPVRNWVAIQGIEEIYEEDLPEEYEDIHTEDSTLKITITNPVEETKVDPEDSLTIEVDYQGMYSLQKLEYFLNGQYLGESISLPFIFTFVPQEINFIEEGKNTIRVVAFDEFGGTTESTSSFKVPEILETS